jgi:CubicO group peptidase (beta-lactamase class C family)
MRIAPLLLLLLACATAADRPRERPANATSLDYSIRLKGRVVGEEQIEIRDVAPTKRRLVSRASIGPHRDVRTTAEYELDGDVVKRVHVTRTDGDGDGGPMHADEVDSDLVANWVLAAERIAAGARTIDFDRIELNAGEHLERATAGEVRWTVKPNGDAWDIEMQGRAGTRTRAAKLFLDRANRPVKIEIDDELVIERADAFPAYVDGVMHREMEREKIPGAAFAFVKDGRIELMKGYGLANVETQSRVDPENTLWRVGSISKTFTATAMVLLAEDGRVQLAADAQQYLSRVRIPENYPLQVTVADLLMHTAGFDEIRPGTQVETAAEVQSLPDFLRTRLVRIRPPGSVTAYSTYGITVAGAIIEEVTRKPFEEAMRELVWQPLAMTRTNITVPAELRADVAMGYERNGETLVPQAWEWYHTTPASSINSTAADMSKYMLAHLRGDYAREMKRQHATMHPLLPGVTYGFFEEQLGDLRVVEHGGNMAGFSAQMTLIPSENAGFFIVNHFEGSSLRNNVRSALLEYLYPAARVRHVPPAPPAGFAKRAAAFAGRYVPMFGCVTCKPRRAPLIINVKGDGDVLVINNQRWVEVDPLVFVHEGGGGRNVFRTDAAGKVVMMSSGGFWTFEKLDETE